jgi:hypothetical protein
VFGKRGQLFSADFLASALALAVALSFAVQAMGFQFKSLKGIEAGGYEALAVAEAVNSKSFQTTALNCVQFSNGSGNCASFACPKSTFSAKRLTVCSPGASQAVCSVEVRVCG